MPPSFGLATCIVRKQSGSVLVRIEHVRDVGKPLPNYVAFIVCPAPPSVLQDYLETDAHRIGVDRTNAEQLFRLVREARIPPVGNSAMGLDGSSYEIHFGDAFGGASYRWWLQPPQGWEPLAEAIAIMIRHVPFYF